MAALRIAQAQINTTVGDFAGNVEKIAAAVGRARDLDADVVTFPELALCGYPPEDLLLRPRFLGDSRKALERVIAGAGGVTTILGFPHFADGGVHNAAAIISAGVLINTYHKVELPNYGVFDEKRYFIPGTGCQIININGVRVGVTICEDIWIEGGAVEKSMIESRAAIVLNISGSPFHAGKLAARCEIVGRFAKRTGAIVCYSNLVGGHDELVFDGGSLVVAPDGRVLATAARFEEDLLVTNINVSGADSHDSPASTAAELGQTEEICAALVLGTRDYVRKNGFKKVVIGLSGGIDSSLTAAIAVEALGKGNVVGVTMPSQHTSSATRSDAERLASNMGIELVTVPIEAVYSTYVETLAEPFGEGPPGIEHENLQARIRGNFLMALSNCFGWLVLTTGNKSETAVGYCTLYGDMAGGFAVIKDVPKTTVYELAEYVNRKAGRDVIPRSVMQRPPTAELRPDQKDEDSLPPYAVLDPILRAYVEEDKSPDEIAAEGFDIDIVTEVVRMVDRNEYKRRQAPPGIKITPKAFGRDRRLPITNRYSSQADAP